MVDVLLKGIWEVPEDSREIINNSSFLSERIIEKKKNIN